MGPQDSLILWQMQLRWTLFQMSYIAPCHYINHYFTFSHYINHSFTFTFSHYINHSFTFTFSHYINHFFTFSHYINHSFAFCLIILSPSVCQSAPFRLTIISLLLVVCYYQSTVTQHYYRFISTDISQVVSLKFLIASSACKLAQLLF